MNQANYGIMLKAAQDHRDEEIDNLRSTLSIVTKKLTEGSSLDQSTVDKVKKITDKTPKANNEQPNQTPTPQLQTQQTVQPKDPSAPRQVPRNILKSRTVLTPDNVKCCEYYSSLNDKTDEELVWYVIGDANTDKIMQGRLRYIL